MIFGLVKDGRKSAKKNTRDSKVSFVQNTTAGDNEMLLWFVMQVFYLRFKYIIASLIMSKTI